MRGIPIHLVALAALAGGCSFDSSALGIGGAGGSDGGPGAPDARASADAGDGPDDPDTPDAAVETTGLVTCAATAVAPDVSDGEVSGDWTGATWYQFASADAELIADAHAQYNFDASLTFACLHDDTRLYFFLEVTDDEVLYNDGSTVLREDDGVVLFIDGDGDRSGAYEATDHALMITPQPRVLDYGPGDLVPTGVRFMTDAGYNLEIAMDKDEIADPLPSQLGFNVAIIDDDGLGNSDRDVFALRHVPDPPACESCCDGQAEPWCNTGVNGMLILAD